MKWQRHHTRRPMTWPGHSNDMNFISFATPFHIIDFIGFNEISVLSFAICTWYTMVATSDSRYFYALVRLSSITRTIIYDVSHISSESLNTIVMDSTTLGASLRCQGCCNDQEYCKSLTLLWYLLQMRKYHDLLHGQAQQPTPSTAASRQQRQSWHDLAGQYGLEDMLEVSGTSSQLCQGVEEQFELYENGPISPRSTDIIGFWAVSTMSHYFPICVTDLFADKRRNPSNIIRDGIRLSAHSSVLGSIQAHFFIQCQNWYKEAKSNPPGLNGGTSNAEVFAQAVTAKLYRWMGCHWRRTRVLGRWQQRFSRFAREANFGD